MSDDETPGAELDPSPGGFRDKAWWDAHPEEKEKQRLRALEQVQRGQFGGQHHGRRRKRPAYEVTAAKAAEKAEQLSTELIDLALNAPQRGQRLQALKLLFDQEQRVRQERRDEEDHFARLSGDELTAELFRAIRELTGADEFDYELDPDQVEEVGVGNVEEGHED